MHFGLWWVDAFYDELLPNVLHSWSAIERVFWAGVLTHTYYTKNHIVTCKLSCSNNRPFRMQTGWWVAAALLFECVWHSEKYIELEALTLLVLFFFFLSGGNFGREGVDLGGGVNSTATAGNYTKCKGMQRATETNRASQCVSACEQPCMWCLVRFFLKSEGCCNESVKSSINAGHHLFLFRGLLSSSNMLIGACIVSFEQYLWTLRHCLSRDMPGLFASGLTVNFTWKVFGKANASNAKGHTTACG